MSRIVKGYSQPLQTRKRKFQTTRVAGNPESGQSECRGLRTGGLLGLYVNAFSSSSLNSPHSETGVVSLRTGDQLFGGQFHRLRNHHL